MVGVLVVGVGGVRAQSGLPGDGNGDCKVDGVDFVILLNHYGQTTSGGPGVGDFSGDGKVDGVDFVILLYHYGWICQTVTTTPTRTPTPRPTATRTPTPTFGPSPTSPPVGSSCQRAYTATSVWNTKVADLGIGIHPDSALMIQNLSAAQNSSYFGSSPDVYAEPIYIVTNSTPNKAIVVSGTFSNVTNNDTTLTKSSGTFQVPIPDAAGASSGTDGHLLVINKDTGDEWGFWKAVQTSSTAWSSTNGYHYNINWDGVPPIGFTSRGAGFSYLAGVLRKCEVVSGRIDHALSYAYNYPCSQATCAARGYPYYVYPPATKSDGGGTSSYALPEGSRVYISPPATAAELTAWCGSDSACRIIEKALEEYGLVLSDGGGHPKLATEDNLTANWGTTLTANTPRNIPLSRFKVLAF